MENNPQNNQPTPNKTIPNNLPNQPTNLEFPTCSEPTELEDSNSLDIQAIRTHIKKR